MSTADADLAAFEAKARAYAVRANGGRTPPAAGRDEIGFADDPGLAADRERAARLNHRAAAAPAPSAFAGQASGPPVPPDKNLGNAAVIAHARAALGDGFEARARRDRERLSGPMPGGAFYGGWFSADRHRCAANLDRVAEGRAMDAAEVEAEVAEAVVREWFGAGSGERLLALVSAAVGHASFCVARLRQMDDQLEYAAGQLKRGLSLDEYGAMFGPDVIGRHEFMAKAVEVGASLRALDGAVASRVASVVGRAGGAGAVSTAIRDALMSRGRWPGADRELAGLEARLMEAAKSMDRFRSPDPEAVEGPLAAAARADRDGLLPMTEARRVEVERLAVARVDALVGSFTSGDTSAFVEIQALAVEVPAAFPPGFVADLHPIPLAAALAAGASGFSLAL